MRRPLPADVASRLEGIKPSGDGYIARCPAHDDRSPSLSVSVSDTGKLLIHCHAGCDQQSVLDAIQATPQMLDPNREERRQDDGEWTPRGPAVAVYSYVDEHSVLLFDVCRTADKQFPQRRPDTAAKSGWSWKLGETRRVLYRLPQVITAVEAGQTIWVAEGEKDVHALEAAGVVATCSPGGAGKWRDEYAQHLADADVVVVADKDKPGQAHARSVAVSVSNHGGRVRIVEAREGKDAADHLRAGFGLEDFLTTHEPDVAAKPELALDIHDYLAQGDDEIEWLIPNLIERGDRIMITAFEGWAKSTFLRQLAVASAAGLHPFTGEPIEPLRVVLVDCENSDRQTRRAFRWILPIAQKIYGSDIPRDTFFPLVRPEGIDLGREEDAQWLLERVTAHKPDLLIIGPVYRLLTEDANTDVTIRRIITAIDKARVAVDCAVVLEAHAGHGSGLNSRSTRPLGSSMWMRWVESGIGFAPFDGTDLEAKTPLELAHWKPGRDRELKHWPRFIRHGSRNRDGEMDEWPWMPDELWGPNGQMVTA
jgi:5S rRNA maturation endonuclease (ribonuclease M5)